MKYLVLILLLILAGCHCDNEQQQPTAPCTGASCPVTHAGEPSVPAASSAWNSAAAIVVNDNTAVPVGGNGDLVLTIGINRYPGAPLEGCVGDVKSIHSFSVAKLGFKESQIIEMTDEQCTKAGIVAALKSFTASARPGDRRFFHQSGHGTEDVVDAADEPDHINQIFCPVDFDWTPAHMLTDKEYVAIFSQMQPGVIFCWLSDSCYSGGLSRPIPKAGRKASSRQYPITPAAVAARVAAAKARGIRNKGMVNGLLDVGYVSGCGPKQTSADVQDSSGSYGAFSHYWIQVFGAHPTNTLRINTAILDDTLNANGYDQQPEAAGARIDKAFLK